ncbi:MAG: glycosyltransferase [Candidatus Omnitrophica bacterium]|nr:glycosyltransferase [Candidatus Omnitrophota bacterium]
MRIVFLTRTGRPSGALIAKCLLDAGKNLVAIVAEERGQLLKKNGSNLSLLSDSFKKHGFSFTKDRLLEFINIKLHYILRKIFGSNIFRSKHYLSIEELVLDYKIPFFLVKDHNGVDSENIIRKFNPDLVVLTNTRLIKKNIFQIPKSGCLNLHGSLLPKYAGLDSNFWALFNKENETGVTVHFVNEELDRGDILIQKKITIWPFDNEKTLYLRGLALGSKMVVEVVTQIENNRAMPVKQDLGLATKFSWPTKIQRKLLSKMIKERLKDSNRPIRVLHIITRLIKGGAQENTLLTVLGLREKGYQVMLASGPTSGPEGEIESVVRRQNIDLAVIPELVRQVNPVKDLISLVKLYFLIKRYRFDIVHTHTSKAGIVGRLAAKLAGVQVVVHTPHGHVFHSYFGRFESMLYRFLEMIFSCFCDKIITLTDNCKNEHLKLKIATADKFITIPSGVKVEDFNGSFDNKKTKGELGIPLDRKVIGTVARIEPIKGISFFVEAMPQVLEKFPNSHFLLVGDGSQRKFLQNRVEELGISQKVIFSGIRQDVARMISIMDIFVLCSLNEGMGRVLVEAGVMGKPSVATKVSGIPELVKDGESGVLVEPASSSELAKGIIQLLSYPDKAKLFGENARKIMNENFSAKEMVNRIDNLYCELLKIKKSSLRGARSATKQS